MSRCSYCDFSATALLWVSGFVTAGNWRGKIELRVTNDREDGRDCGIHGGAERRRQRDFGCVPWSAAEGRRYGAP